MNKRTAQRLWDQLKQHLVNAERVLQEIIAERAWESMGYDSFAEAWDAQDMDEITFAPELRPHVVYEMYAEGRTVADVAKSVKGIGPERAKSLARQRMSGVPASKASLSRKPVSVRPHGRGKAAAPYRIISEFTAAKKREFDKIAKDYDTTVEIIAKEAIEERFSMLLALESRRA